MEETKEVRQIPIEYVIPNRFQPRINFDEKALNELSESIKQHGIIQPLVVRPLGDKFEIIAGERRYKAATLAGLQTVPAIVTEMDDSSSAEVALIENVQRKDLSSIEEAKSYKSMLERSNMTQEELAKKMGLSQSTIANKLRLLNLSDAVQKALMEEKISERHARALLSIQDPEEQKRWLDRILKERLTVRQLDLAIKDELSEKNNNEKNNGDIPIVNINPDIESIINNAVDINPQENKEVINNDLISNNEIEQQEQHKEKIPNKFFNFLEDQEVNMNFTEEPTKEKEIESIPEEFSFTPEFNDIPQNNVQNEEIETLDVNSEPEENKEVIEEPIFVPEPQTENIVENQILNQEQQLINNNNQLIEEENNNQINKFEITNNNEVKTKEQTEEKFVFDEEPELLEEDTIEVEPIPPMTGEGVVDPVTYYDTLDPNFLEKIRKTIGLDLKTAINTYRDVTSVLKEKGFIINVDEADMDGTYRIQIDIKEE